MDGYGITKATTRRLAAPALGLLLSITVAATPAQAAVTPPTPAAPATPAAVAVAGPAWAQLMHRKLDLAADAVRLTAALPALRAAVITRTADVAQAQQNLLTAAATAATATTADQSARWKHATATTAAATAKKALIAEQKRRPSSKTRLAKAKQTVATAEATVRSRARTVAQATAALQTARTAYTVTTDALVAATTAGQAATKAVTDAQQRIAAQPALDKALAAQAAALSQQVVTETRANFTTEGTTPVYGITVNKVIAYPFQHLLDDAAKAGISLSGGGFRTRQQQIALRTANGCPDIYTAPSSSCRVPTAIPGRSLHELGLAIDITVNKKAITDRKSPAFKWLTTNAARYGLINLPAEPWHWSITGS